MPNEPSETTEGQQVAPDPAQGPLSDAVSPETSERWTPDRSPGQLIFFSAVLVIGASLVMYAWELWPFTSSDQTTTNAYVRGNITAISPRVSGYVTAVHVQDFQSVKPGQPLVAIDARDYRAQYDQGTANVAAQQAGLANSVQDRRSSEAQVRLQDAAVAAAQAQLAKARADLKRIDELVGQGSVSERERDSASAALQQAQAGVREALAQRATAMERVKSVNVNRGALEAAVDAAAAAREQAQLNLQRTTIAAPNSGRLSEVTVRVGQLVSPGTQLMYLVPRDYWVVANFKEAQTAGIRVGQRASMKVDALGGDEILGTVESIAPAAGSEFSVIKPDTGSGNFVKVPQRIAVRIKLDRGQSAYDRLAPGMSVVATVHTAGK